MERDTLFIFIDESGDFNFGSSGSEYFILCGVSTLTPLENRSIFTKIKYDLLKEGLDIESFHATEDKQFIRNQIFRSIQSLPDLEIDCVVAEKSKVEENLYQEIRNTIGALSTKVRVEEKFYKLLCQELIYTIVERHVALSLNTSIKKIVVILDKVFTSQKRSLITKHVKTSIKNSFGIVPYVYFHQMKSDLNCQISDYCCWAFHSKWTKGERRPYSEIAHKVRSEHRMF